eukprot:g2798.t1
MATPGGSKTTVISSLVQQLKKGEISKSELFEQLAKLQQRPAAEQPEGSATGAGTTPVAPTTPAADPARPAPQSAAAATAERRARLQRLIEEKRRKLEVEAQQPSSASGSAAGVPTPAANLSAQEYMSSTPGQQMQHQANLLQQQAQMLQGNSVVDDGGGATPFSAAAGAPPPPPPGVAAAAPPAPPSAAAVVAAHEHAQARRNQFGADAFERLRRKMLAVSFGTYGVDLHTLFTRAERERAAHSGSKLSSEELRGLVQKLLPGAVDGGQAQRLVGVLEKDRSGRVDFRDFVALFDGSGGSAGAAPPEVPPYPFAAAEEESGAAGSIGAALSAGLPQQLSKAEVAAQERQNKVLKECTFKPAIRPLPASYGTMRDKNVPFHERVQRWQEQKQTELSRIKKEQKGSELRECTFHPSINPNPDPGGMLEDGEELGSAPLSTGMSASQRLYANSKTTHTREEAQRSAEAREQEELDRTCTFKPQINRGRYTPRAQAKYRQVDYTPGKAKGPASTGTPARSRLSSGGGYAAVGSSRRAARAQAARSDPNCTFTPKVNSISRGMASARVYLQAGVYDRLSNPDGTRAAERAEGGAPGENQQNTSNVLSMDSFRSMAGDTSGAAQAGRGGRPGTAPAGTPGGKQMNGSDIKAFWRRQNAALDAKRKHVSSMQKHLEQKHSFTPKINKSRINRVLEGHGNARSSVGDRLDQDARRRQAHARNKQLHKDRSMQGCTFQPQITPHASTSGRKARSALEMSRGDMLKKETAHRIMKLKVCPCDVLGLPRPRPQPSYPSASVIV